MLSTFLTEEEMITLTGRKLKKCQIEVLRRMGIPFYINAANRPIVTRSVIEGKPQETDAIKKAWSPKVVSGSRA